MVTQSLMRWKLTSRGLSPRGLSDLKPTSHVVKLGATERFIRTSIRTCLRTDSLGLRDTYLTRWRATKLKVP